MTTANLVLIGVAVVAIFGALGAFAVAFRRARDDSDWQSRVEPDARAADRSMRGVRVEPVPVREPVGAEPEPEAQPEEEAEAPPEGEEPEREEPEGAAEEEEPVPAGVQVVETQRVVEVSPEEAGVTRRQFFNRALGATFALWSTGLGLGILAFLWPRVSGGFGADINAGPISDIEGETRNSDGEVVPLFIPEARAYVVPAPAELSEQFEGEGVAAGGMMALYQRCVHLGCRVPWCATSVGFECPCHGSKYNAIGEYFDGPAPRNLDRFTVETTETNELIIHTGTIVETPRAPSPSVEYPRGPSCI